jgi:NodT family efflux transporter outer membrane factor (OMF) lipoprotein
MPENRQTTLAASLLAALAMAGCAALPGSQPSSAPIVDLALPAMPAPQDAVDAWPAEDWWTAYADPQLDALIARALADSPTLAGANARMAQASAALGIARGNAAPQVNADLSVTRGRQSANYLLPPPPLGPGGEYTNIGNANINLSYDLDFWGRNAALIAAAGDEANASAFDFAAARLALTTNIVRAYAQLAAQYELLDIAEATLKQREQIADLTRQRRAAGLDTNVEVRQAETGTASLAAERVQLENAIAVSRLQLVALVGAMPDAAGGIARPKLKTPPFNLPAKLPLDLLARRPEIAAQRARIGAAHEEIRAAKTLFYPNINLTALIGFQSIGVGKLFEASSQTSSLGPAIHLPIFDGGRLRANYAGRVADLDAAVAQYNQSVLAAAQDAIEQLTRCSNLEREGAATSAALDHASEAYRLALLRYREGLSPYLTVLAVENQLLTQRRATADLNARRLDLQITLVRALGGGFNAAPSDQPSEKQP